MFRPAIVQFRAPRADINESPFAPLEEQPMSPSPSSARARRLESRRRARWTLLLTVMLFLAIQGVCSLAMERWRPELYDPDFTRHLAILQARRAEMPTGPLLLVTGSSRLVMAFQPETLRPLYTPEGGQALPFNFAHIGSGPVMELVHLRRLLDHGIQPRWMVVEVMPCFLAHEPSSFLTMFLGAHDLPVAQRYTEPAQLYARYLWDRLVVSHRFQEDWLSRKLHTQDAESFWHGSGEIQPYGGYPYLIPAITPAERQRLLAVSFGSYEETLRAYHISPSGNRAMHDLLELCREHQIQTVLLMTPEGSEIRSWYAPSGREVYARYTQQLGREFHAPVIDARDWLTDDDFYDSHHTLQHGAVKFTRRFEREVLQPLVQGKLHPEP